MRTQFVWSEIRIGLRRNLTMTVAVVISVALSLALAGATLLLRDQVNSVQSYWSGRVELSVYFCSKGDALNPKFRNCASGAATKSDKEAVKAELAKTGLVQSITEQSAVEQLAEFRKQFSNSPLTPYTKLDAFGGALHIKLTDPRQYVVLTDLADAQAGVTYADDQSQVLKPLFKLLDGAQVIALVVMGIMLTVTLLLIVNTVRLSAFSRRRETGVMRLVGASNLSVQLPFIAEAAVAGAVGAVLASGLLALGRYLVIDRFLSPEVSLITFIGWRPVFEVMPLMLVLGVGISSVAAFLTLRRHLKV